MRSVIIIPIHWEYDFQNIQGSALANWQTLKKP